MSIVIKLPETESISAQAFAYHGISVADCLNAQDFSLALKPIIASLRQGAHICCHNLSTTRNVNALPRVTKTHSYELAHVVRR